MDAKSGLTFMAVLVITAVISSLTARLLHQRQVARATAFRAEALYGLNLELSGIGDEKQLAAVAARHLERIFAARVTVLLRTHEGGFDRALGKRELELAERAWFHRDFVKSETSKGASIWVPLVGISTATGLIGLSVPAGFEKESDQGLLLAACASQVAVTIDRIQIANAVHRTELETETERLRNSLLSAVSHDLKTPLATMIAAGTTLIGRGRELPPAEADALLGTIVSEGERLSRLIQNVLSITRLESPTIELRRTPEAVDELVSVAVRRFGGRLEKPSVKVELEDDLPLVSAEPLLLEQVLINLLENGARYAGPEARLYVQALRANGMVAVRVADDGPGIPEEEREKVFEKFYRGRRAGKSDGGAGLGLTICRAIVRAHGGRIAVRERKGGGALVEFTLPVSSAPVFGPGEEHRSEGAPAS
jgi:two-component system sensor histidine kinase KdpD